MKKLAIILLLLLLGLLAPMFVSFSGKAINGWSTPTKLTNNAADDWVPSISSDGSKIAFSSDVDGDYDIWVVNSDGSGLTKLTSNTASDYGPSISGDGSKIAFSSDVDGDDEIFVVNSDGSGLTKLTSNTLTDKSPSISGDGSKIAFQSYVDGDYDIWVVNSDGSGLTALFSSSLMDINPSISGDGSKIAFEAWMEGGMTWITVVNTDASDWNYVTSGYGSDPSIDFDGEKIAFDAYSGSGYELFVINSDGSGQTQVTTNYENVWSNSISGDGSKIAFSSDVDGDNEIYAVSSESPPPPTGPVYIDGFTDFPAYPYNIPAYMQGGAYVGCGPTSGAMFLGYFEHHFGATGLLTNPVAGVDEGLDTAWELHSQSYMKTQDNGFGPAVEIKPGLEDYAEDRGHEIQVMAHAPTWHDPSTSWFNDYGTYGDAWTNDGDFWVDLGADMWDIDPDKFCDFISPKLSAGICIFLTVDSALPEGGDHWIPCVGYDKDAGIYYYYNTYDTALHSATIASADATTAAGDYAITFVRSIEYIPAATRALLIEFVGSGTTDPSPGSHTYSEGTDVSVDAQPASGWQLDHWELDGVDVGTTDPYTVTMDADHTLRAVFVEIPPTQYELTIEVAGSGTTSPAPGVHTYDEGSVVPVDAQPDAGWMLDHWLLDSVDVGSDDPFPITMDADHTLRAVFVEIPPTQYELTIEVAGSGTTNPALGSHMYSSGTVVSVDAQPDAGWMLDHWLLDSVDVGDADPYEVTMDTNHVLRAVFSETTPVQATITGTVLYNEEPVSDFTSEPAVLWARNESSGEVFPISPTYDTSTGEYSISDVPPGEYGISVFIDDALPSNGEHGFAGDFDGWNSPIVVPEGQPLVQKNLTVVKTLHITSPVDNAAVIGPWSYPEDTYPTEKMMFTWDALAEASSYHASIGEYDRSIDFEYVGLVTSNITSDVKWNVTLPMSVENHLYSFNLYAYNINDVMVGKLMIPYGAGYGWDYRFRLAPQAIVESCNSAGDQNDLFDLGETVYVTGGNYSSSTTYNFSIVVDEETWSNGMAIPERVPGTATTISSNIDGDIPPTAVWSDPQTIGEYDIVVDVNGNGQYDAGIDALDDNDIEVTAGCSVIPEFSSSSILLLFVITTLLSVIIYRRR